MQSNTHRQSDIMMCGTVLLRLCQVVSFFSPCLFGAQGGNLFIYTFNESEDSKIDTISLTEETKEAKHIMFCISLGMLGVNFSCTRCLDRHS